MIIEGVTLKCTAAGKEGHGKVNMNQAMAYSCNCYFAKLGEMVGSEAIVEMAEKLGFGQKVMIDFPQESRGNIPSKDEVGPWDITNLSIGQGEILTTPLQIVKMTAIVANGGTEVNPKLILDEKQEYERQLVSEDTAKKVDSMLEDVMTKGTGKGAWQVPVCGKTGTAEAIFEGKDVKNCWFTGYFSVGDNTYAVTVMVERGASGTYTAMPVFRSVVDILSENL